MKLNMKVLLKDKQRAAETEDIYSTSEIMQCWQLQSFLGTIRNLSQEHADLGQQSG